MSSEAIGPRSGLSTVPASCEIPLTVGRPRRAQPPRERADAARNRGKILDAAERLFAERGVSAVSLDAIAAEAQVGKGTVFRRFGDKAGLAAALLDQREYTLQEAILSGPPPLGPGAPPAQRAAAFVEAYIEYVLANPELVRMSETASPGARYRIGAFQFWRRHLAVLSLQAGEPPGRAHVLAHALLAPLAAESLLAALDSGVSRAELAGGLIELTKRAIITRTT